MIFIPTKDILKPWGWLDPKGIFYGCLNAEKLTECALFLAKKDAPFQSSKSSAESYLFRLGYVQLRNLEVIAPLSGVNDQQARKLEARGIYAPARETYEPISVIPSDQQHGWLSPNGKFYPCFLHEHDACIQFITQKEGLHSTMGEQKARTIGYEHGYVQISNGVVIPIKHDLTERQLEMIRERGLIPPQQPEKVALKELSLRLQNLNTMTNFTDGQKILLENLRARGTIHIAHVKRTGLCKVNSNGETVAEITKTELDAVIKTFTSQFKVVGGGFNYGDSEASDEITFYAPSKESPWALEFWEHNHHYGTSFHSEYSLTVCSAQYAEEVTEMLHEKDSGDRLLNFKGDNFEYPKETPYTLGLNSGPTLTENDIEKPSRYQKLADLLNEPESKPLLQHLSQNDAICYLVLKTSLEQVRPIPSHELHVVEDWISYGASSQVKNVLKEELQKYKSMSRKYEFELEDERWENKSWRENEPAEAETAIKHALRKAMARRGKGHEHK